MKLEKESVWKPSVGLTNFARNFINTQVSVPQSRYIDMEYSRFISRSLLDDDKDEEIADISERREIFLKYCDERQFLAKEK